MPERPCGTDDRRSAADQDSPAAEFESGQSWQSSLTETVVGHANTLNGSGHAVLDGDDAAGHLENARARTPGDVRVKTSARTGDVRLKTSVRQSAAATTAPKACGAEGLASTVASASSAASERGSGRRRTSLPTTKVSSILGRPPFPRTRSRGPTGQQDT